MDFSGVLSGIANTLGMCFLGLANMFFALGQVDAPQQEALGHAPQQEGTGEEWAAWDAEHDHDDDDDDYEDPWYSYSSYDWDQWDTLVAVRRDIGAGQGLYTKQEWADHYGIRPDQFHEIRPRA